MTTKARRVVRALFDVLLANPDLMPDEHGEAARRAGGEQGEAGQARAVADYIAGMTDRYAILEYERLFDPAERT
jgi:dGTPase